jgi:hypothetical protein
MAMAILWDGDGEGMMNNGGGEAVDLPRVCFWCNLRMTALCTAVEVSKYIGAFMKGVQFVQANAVRGGKGGRYRLPTPVTVLVNTTRYSSSTPVDLRVLATTDSSLFFPLFAIQTWFPTSQNLKQGVPHLCTNYSLVARLERYFITCLT